MSRNIETQCIHGVALTPPPNHAVTSGVFPAIAYDYLEHPELNYPGFYSTYNQERLGQLIATLEQGVWGTVFSSGMAAITTSILAVVNHGDHIIFARDLYGGTLKLAAEELPKRGINCSFADTDVAHFATLVQPNTKAIYIETPSNPLLKITDIKAIVKLAKQHGLVTIIDNTFATPINQLPLRLGIDISVHSGTKYLGGHNDLPFGALTVRDELFKELILTTAKMYGGSLSPFACYLAERSLKTLALRVERQNANALLIAKHLSDHPKIQSVYYPGLPSHPQHHLAKSQMTAFGGMVSFELAGGLTEANRFQQKLKIISSALSLGGVESLISSPILTSHRYLSAEERKHLGINESLLRLSVGIEHIEDIVSDIDAALAS